VSEQIILTALAGIVLAWVSNWIGFRAGREQGFFDGNRIGYRKGHRSGWISGCLEGAKHHAFATGKNTSAASATEGGNAGVPQNVAGTPVPTNPNENQ